MRVTRPKRAKNMHSKKGFFYFLEFTFWIRFGCVTGIKN